MKITVNKDNVKIEEFDIVHEGEHRVNKCSFSFSEEYTEELVKKAIFTSQNSSVEVAIINNECNIPTEILKARNIVLLGVYAYKVTEDKLDLRYSPSPDAFKVNSGSYIEGTSESEEITPSQFEQYMQALNDGLNKVEESIKEMDSATSSANDLVDDINQKLENGEFNGTNGKDGVGIASITSGQSIQQDGNTVTPVTVNKTDGTQQTFNVSAKNGIDGINGTDGNDGVTPNLQIGTVITLEPNEQATVTRTGTAEQPVFNFGIPKGQQGEQGIQGIPGQDGQPGADGQPGQDGADGKDATINGQNTVEITTDNNITLEQQENILKFGLDSQLIPKQDAEGTDNIFTDGLESPLYDLGGDGKSEQVVTTGKNLCDGVNQYYYLNNEVFRCGQNVGDSGLAINVSQYSQLTVSTQSIQKRYRVGCVDSLPTGSGSSEVPVFNGVNKDGTNDSITVDTTDYNYLIINATNLSVIQVEEGSVATSYEPYTGGQPSPSPDYEQPINSIEGSLEFDCRGKNWLNYTESSTEWAGATITTKGTTVTYTPQSDGFAGMSHNSNEMNVNLKKGETYTFSQEYVSGNKWTSGTLTNTLHLIDSNGIDTQLKLNDFTAQNYLEKHYNSITLDRDIVKVYSDCLMYSINGMNTPIVMHFQLEKGTKATPYEPYIEPNKVTFNLNDEKLRSVGDVKDELVVDLDTGDYYKVENIKEIAVNSTNFTISKGNIVGNIQQFALHSKNSDVNLPVSSTENNNKKIINSNYFKGYQYSGGWNVDQTITGWTDTAIRINTSSFSEVEQLSNFLDSNNVIANYVTSNPTTVPLGTLSAEDLAKLKTFKGYNNVTVNTNLGLMNIRFTYGLDIKKYVDNKIAEISTAMIEEG